MDPLCGQDGILIDGLNLMAVIKIHDLRNEKIKFKNHMQQCDKLELTVRYFTLYFPAS